MIDYQKPKKVCQQSSAISGLVIDDFLIPYAAKHDKLEYEASQKLGKYKHIMRKQD
jgi:hypothetical protein